VSSLTAGTDRAVQALELADISPERFGRARIARLAPAERRFYRWILREFAGSTPPSAEATRAAAEEFALVPEQALELLAREDLVHTDDDGRPVVAYPFAGNDRGHRVLIDRAYEVQAMCAIDALGIAPMLDLPIEIVSRDPISGAEIRVQLDPAGAATWQPAAAVVLAGSASCDGPSFCGCCDVLNFFETTANADRYLREHSEIQGTVISIREAIEAGRTVFGDALRED
jgi:hypothetical protein